MTYRLSITIGKKNSSVKRIKKKGLSHEMQFMHDIEQLVCNLYDVWRMCRATALFLCHRKLRFYDVKRDVHLRE